MKEREGQEEEEAGEEGGEGEGDRGGAGGLPAGVEVTAAYTTGMLVLSGARGTFQEAHGVDTKVKFSRSYKLPGVDKVGGWQVVGGATDLGLLGSGGCQALSSHVTYQSFYKT